MHRVTSFISKQEINDNDAIRGDSIRQPLFEMIRKEYPGFSADSFVSLPELNHFRNKQLEQIISDENGEINSLEAEVVHAISTNKLLSDNIEESIDDKQTFGQRVADKIAEFGGSWTFILAFFSFILIWMGINIWVLTKKPFDPFPFILLNLILSCLAAIQAPIIMMSQNRQEQKDRIRNEHDYKINLKAELEIKILNEKIDHLIIHQNKRLLETQQIQADFLEEIMKSVKGTQNENRK